MRVAGLTLTLAALAAVQIPWIVCTSDCQQIVTRSAEHACHAHAHHGHGHDHAHHHGHDHGHVHAHVHHMPCFLDHEDLHDDETPDHEHGDHQAYLLPLLETGQSVELEAPAWLALFASVPTAPARMTESDSLALREEDDRPGVPPAATERLLL